MSGHITGYRNTDRISLANSRLLSLGKSETGSLYFDLYYASSIPSRFMMSSFHFSLSGLGSVSLIRKMR